MPECHKYHYDERAKVVIPHEYIVGICIQQNIIGSSLLSFLEYTYPYYRSDNYEASRTLQYKPEP